MARLADLDIDALEGRVDQFLKNLIPDLSDLFFFGGLVALSYGVYLAYPPAAFITAGMVLMAIGLWRFFKPWRGP